MKDSQSAAPNAIPSIVVKSVDQDAHRFLVPGMKE